MRPPLTAPKAQSDHDLRKPSNAVSHHFPTDTCNTDSDLELLVHAWEQLPIAIRAGIIAMVKAAT
jgi:hypothetical protein